MFSQMSMMFETRAMVPRIAFLLVKTKQGGFTQPSEEKQVELDLTLRLARFCFKYSIQSEISAKCFFIKEDATPKGNEMTIVANKVRDFLIQTRNKEPKAICKFDILT